MTRIPIFNRIRKQVFGMLSLPGVPATLIIVALTCFGFGCGDSDPSGPGHTDDGLVMSVTRVPVLFGPQEPAEPLAQQTLRIQIFDVSDNPQVRTSELIDSGVPPIVDDTAVGEVPEGGVAFLDASYQFDIGNEPRDFRIRIRHEELRRQGTRTIENLTSGETRSADIYLTPDSAGPGEYGIQVVETWADPGAQGHLIPIALVNATELGGFQFDLVFGDGAVDTFNDIEVDADSRLFLDADSSAITLISDNPIEGESRWKVIVFSDNSERSIDAGYEVVLYLSADIAAGAETVGLTLENVVLSDPTGESIQTDSLAIQGATLHIGETP